MSNAYGIQKVKETKPRSGGDIAGATLAAGAKGAAMGAKFGPWGAAAVGGGMMLAEYANQDAAQFNEERAYSQDTVYNRGVDSMNRMAVDQDHALVKQARYGMKNDGRYETVEIEGDGSGGGEGIGEIHVDKNYNIKNIAKGSPSHEDGGHVVNNLEESKERGMPARTPLRSRSRWWRGTRGGWFHGVDSRYGRTGPPGGGRVRRVFQ